jgi:hypothetical protein
VESASGNRLESKPQHLDGHCCTETDQELRRQKDLTGSVSCSGSRHCRFEAGSHNCREGTRTDWSSGIGPTAGWVNSASSSSWSSSTATTSGRTFGASTARAAGAATKQASVRSRSLRKGSCQSGEGTMRIDAMNNGNRNRTSAAECRLHPPDAAHARARL